MDFVSIMSTLGVPVAAMAACAIFIYQLVNRDKDEAKQREDRLLDSTAKTAVSLEKVADTIKESNELNKSLSDTNTKLVESLKVVETKVDKIDHNIEKLLEK